MDVAYEKEGGWAWCVTAASFIAHCIVCGISYSCGIFHRIFLVHNGGTHFETAWIAALLLSFTALGGLTCMARLADRGGIINWKSVQLWSQGAVAKVTRVWDFLTGIAAGLILSGSLLEGIPGYLVTYQFGYRAAVIAGGLLSATGLALAALAGHMYEFYLTIGVLTGLGFGIALTPAVMIIEVYFYERRTLASNISVSGVSIGMFLLPLIVYKLEDVFAWKGMCLVLAGLCLNICLCGACFRQNDVTSQRKDLLKMFELSLLKSSAFCALIWANYVWSFGISIIFTNLPDYVVFSGQTSQDGASLIAVCGLSAFISRSMFVIFSQSAKLDHCSTFICTVCLAAILTGLFPQMFQEKAGEIGYAIILGMHCGYWSVFISSIIEELIGEEYIAYGKGTICVSVGLGLLSGAPVSGWLFDMKGDFEISFYLAGSCLVSSSVVMMIVNLRRCHLRPVIDWSEGSDTESCRSGASRLSCAGDDTQLIVSLKPSHLSVDPPTEVAWRDESSPASHAATAQDSEA